MFKAPASWTYNELADALRVMGKSERDIQQLLKELVAPFPQPYSHNADVHDVPDVKSTGFVDKQELADAWRFMGVTERENQQLLDELNLEQRKKLISPSPQRYFHNVDVPVVGSRDTVPNLRKARVPGSKLPLCWHGDQRPWRRRGRCSFRHCDAENDVVRPEIGGVEEIKAELRALWAAFRKLVASFMWRTGSKSVALAAPSIAAEQVPAPADAYATPAPVIEYAAPAPSVTNTAPAPVTVYMAPAPAVTYATPAPETDYVTHPPVIDYITPAPAVTFPTLIQLLPPAYTMESVTTGVSLVSNGLVNAQSPVTPVEASASKVNGSLPRLDESAALVYHHARQEQIAAGETTQNTVESPTVEEHLIVPEIPGTNCGVHYGVSERA